MKIFIDFDDVLFNTKLFYEGIKNVFFENGISEEVFKKYYKDPETEKKRGIIQKYNPYKQIEKIGKTGINTKKLKRDFSDFIKNTSQYIFEDGIEFLKKVKNEDLYIISYGDKKFQNEKIINSGISKYFKRILIAETTKAAAIRKILNKKTKEGEALIFIDDRERFLRNIKESYPGMVTFLFNNSLGRYNDEKTGHCDFKVKNFNEVLKIIGF